MDIWGTSHVTNAYDDRYDTVVESVSWREDWDTITKLGHDVTRVGGRIAGAAVTP